MLNLAKYWLKNTSMHSQCFKSLYKFSNGLHRARKEVTFVHSGRTYKRPFAFLHLTKACILLLIVSKDFDYELP